MPDKDTKKYIDWLKENDPIAYHELMNDPMIVGENDTSSFGLFLVLVIILASIASFIIMHYFYKT